jgi:hypothetical protein
MESKLKRAFLALLLVGVAAPMSATSEMTVAGKVRGEVFSALAQLPVPATTMNVKIYINAYSTEQEAQRLQGLLRDGGPGALLKALAKMKPKGRIERDGRIGFYDFKLIVSTPTSTGRHIYAVADRPIGFLEAYANSRSRDYPFGILELDLTEKSNEKERGEGTLIYAAKIKLLSGDKVDIENFSFAPIKLLSVREF